MIKVLQMNLAIVDWIVMRRTSPLCWASASVSRCHRQKQAYQLPKAQAASKVTR